MNDNVYQHFRKEERETIDQLSTYISDTSINYSPTLTDFMNPRERYIAQTLVNKNGDIKIASAGGYESADRKRLLFYPDYFEPTVTDFDLQILEIKYPQKFATLHHGQILGALMNSGIKREVLGDIITDGERWQLIAEKQIARFLLGELKQIGKVKVQLEQKEASEILTPLSSWNSELLLVSSLRVDVIVAAAYHLSRQRVKELIEGLKIQVNWTPVDRSDYLVSVYDVISVRGYGRVRLDAVNGETRKGKIKVDVSIIHK